jgi:quinolinate synthase
MVQAPLPLEYSQLSDEETHERIRRAKQSLGERVVIMGHHYQRDEIIQHADYRGDSYKLARDATRHPEAEFIVFCGVHFMAETADILTPDYQKVILPNMSAGCSMADMANIYQVRACWRELTSLFPPDSIVPVTYMNSAANLKAFCGERGGIVCTSSNARAHPHLGITAGRAGALLPRPASWAQHGYQDGHKPRYRDGGMEPRPASRRQHGGGAAPREAHPLEGTLLGAHALYGGAD